MTEKKQVTDDRWVDTMTDPPQNEPPFSGVDAPVEARHTKPEGFEQLSKGRGLVNGCLRDKKTGRFLVTHGQGHQQRVMNKRLRERADEVSALMAGFLSDAGGVENCSAIRMGLMQRLAEAHVFAKLAAEGVGRAAKLGSRPTITAIEAYGRLATLQLRLSHEVGVVASVKAAGESQGLRTAGVSSEARTGGGRHE